MTLIFTPGETIEFIGDSITDSGRTQPGFSPFGEGYVHPIHDLLQAGYPELKFQVINKGISGDRTTDLKSRWESDVCSINLDWLFIYIGINDVWRFFDGSREEAVPSADFDIIYHQLIEDAQTNTQANLRLVSPFLAEDNLTDPFRERLSMYQSAFDTLASDLNLPVVHLQPTFDWAMLTHPTEYWTKNRVHPTRVGHMLGRAAIKTVMLRAPHA